MNLTPGLILRRGRERLRKSRAQIAMDVHKTERTIKSWELDETRPRSFKDIENVCRACGVTVQEYITGTQLTEELLPKQRRLLTAFNIHSEENQEAILSFIETLS